MGYKPQLEKVSLERVRESLIAISYCEPERLSLMAEPEIFNGEDDIAVVETRVETVIDELISIASYAPSMNCDHNNCNGFVGV